MTTFARPRVLHIGKFYPPDYLGGIESYTQNLCRSLRDSVDFRVAVSATHGRTIEEIIDGVPVLRMATAFKFSSAPISPRLRHQLRHPEADLLHFHLPNPAAVLAWLTARAPRLPIIASYHSDIVRQKFAGALFEPLHQKFLRQCAAIIVASPDYLESSPALQPHRDRCHLIPYGVDVDALRSAHSGAEALRRLYGPRMVLAIGRLVYYKGFESLISAFRDVPGKLVIVGEGPLRASLQRLIRRLGLTQRVFLIGRVESVAAYYHACDLFILPSIARSEAFGIVQAEAMACGKPVINTRLATGVPFVSLDGVTGLTVPPGNAAALARAINRLLDNDAERHALAAAARLRAERQFSLDLMATRTLQLYQCVLGIVQPASVAASSA
jgi:glycosyltransferase involved in cell wall biosynthesis